MSKWGDEGFSKEDDEPPKEPKVFSFTDNDPTGNKANSNGGNGNGEDGRKKSNGKQWPQPVAQSRKQHLYMNSTDHAILKQCDRDSTLYRAIPLIISANLVNAYPHMRKGTRPSFLAIGAISVVSYFVGKLSYMPECKRMIANSPSTSIFAEMTRESMGLPPKGWDGLDSPEPEKSEAETKPRRRRKKD